MNFYSQCNEDKILYEKYFKNYTRPGTFLEMGAIDGIRYSNTLYYELNHGWTGILIEPHPIEYMYLLKNRSNNKFTSCTVTPAPLAIRFLRDPSNKR